MQPFSRRLVSQYLLFSLVSIVATGLGVYFASAQFRRQHHSPEHVALLQTTAEAITRDIEANQGKSVQRLVDRAAIAGKLEHCVVVVDGKATHHSAHDQIGRAWTSALPRLDGHIIERAHHHDSDQVALVEYATPLKSKGRTHGVLMLSAPPPESSAWMWRLLEAAPPVILVPMLLVTVGGRFIGYTTQAHSIIEERLHQLSRGAPVSPSILEPLDDAGPVASGWNKLVAHLQHATPTHSRASDSVLSGAMSFREKQAEKALQALPEAIVVTDGEGKVRFANPALAGLLNMGPDAVRGSKLVDILPQGTPSAASARNKLAVDKHRPVVVEFLRGEDPADGCLRIARHPLNPSDSSPAEHVWMIRDVTQQKLAEKARDEFVAAATHELRTPLTNIQAYAETLSLHDIDNEEQRKAFLNTITQEAGRLGRFVDELLSISRMEAGAIALNKQQTDVLRLLNEVVEKVRPQMVQKAMQFETVIPTKVPELKLDKDKLTAALVNLLGNAAKYTPEKGTVTLKVEAQPNALVVHVQDTGYGIAPAEVAKLGTRFFRSADPRVQTATGTGLGLAFTQDVVRLHGGRMTIQSELNKGSTFTVTLPI